MAVAVTVESVDIIDALRSGDTTGAAVETGGLAGTLAGAWIGGQFGSLGGWPGAILGAAVGGYLGESGVENLISKLLDEPHNSEEGGDGEHESDHLPNVSPNTTVITTMTSSGDQISYYDDPVTGLRVATSVEVDSETGEQTAITTTVIANNDPENPAGDLLVGNTYEAGNVAVGQEISVLDQLAGAHNGDNDPNDNPTPPGTDTPPTTTAPDGTGGNGDITDPGGSTNPGGTTGPVDEPDDPSYPPPITTPDIGDFPTTPSTPPYYDPGTTGPQPIILDLDGDGVEIAFGQQTFFDIDDDGFLEQGAWASADDGFLVLDLNADGTRGAGDGVIDQSRELVWSLWGDAGDTDLQALQRAFDDNDDGIIDAQDSVWSELFVWQDINQDGESDEGEVRSLAGWGITQINTNYDDGSSFEDTSDDITVFGNTLHGLASFLHDGSAIAVPDGEQPVDGTYTAAGGVGDVALQFNTLGWRQVETEHGYNIEFESGVTFRYGVLDTLSSANLDVAAANLDGATGDNRNNLLTAAGHIVAVQISGGAGADTLYGGWGDDMLSGDAGADVLLGGEGDDVIFFDADDVDVRGEGGLDVGVLMEFDEFDDEGVLVEAAQGISLDLGVTGFETIRGGDGADDFSIATDHFRSISVSAGNGDDTVTGGAQDDYLSGDAGNDSIRANSGDDVLSGGDGADTLIGNDGDDLVLGGNGSDSLVGGHGDDQLFGGDGDDVLDGRKDDDFLSGGAGDDTILGDIGDDYIQGDDGNDSLVGGEGDDILSGGDGDDTIEGGEGDNTISGGDGDDSIYLSTNGDNWVEAGTGNDTIYAPHHGGRNVIFGGTGQDRLVLEGVREDCSFRGGPSASSGTNQWVVAGAAGITINLHVIIQDIEGVIFSDGTVMGLTGLDPATDNSGTFDPNPLSGHQNSFMGIFGDLSSMPSWAFVQSPSAWTGHYHAGNDYVTGDGGTADIIGGSGNDTLVTGSGTDTLDGSTGGDALDGGASDDTLLGGSGSDSLWGGTGDDSLEGSSGADFLNGGDSEDTLNGGSGSDTLLGGEGADLIYGGHGSDVVLGNDGTDTIFGDGGSDRINGGAGDDQIWGGEGADQIDAGDGNDSIHGENGNDVIDGGTGFDTIYGEDGSDQLDGGLGHDSIIGGMGNDYLEGGSGNDYVEGGWHDDYLSGGEGADTLSGGNGTDFLEGGEGADLINGGNGPIDTASYASSNAAVDVNLYQGTASGGHAENDTLLNIEALQGSRFGDTFTGDEQANILSGEHGNDRLFGHDGNDRLYGGFGADYLTGGWGNDVLVGDGPDVVAPTHGLYYEYFTETAGGGQLDGIHQFSSAPVDQSWFGSSFDVAAIDAARGGDGNHFGLRMSGVLEIEHAGTYQLHLSHDDGLRFFVDGNEIYYGGLAQTTINIDLSAGEHSVTIEYFQHTAPLYLDVSVQGPDTNGEAVAFLESGLVGNPQNNSFVQAQYADELHGGAHDDYLVGGIGSDTLCGDDGDDTLAGGEGDDLLTGGSNGDVFVFTDGFGNDTITDFDVVNAFEHIDLSSVAEIESFDDLVASHVTQVGSDTIIEDGLGNSITLSGVQLSELTNDDFVFV